MKSTASATAINGRWVYPDVLRAAATVMVIILHVGGGMIWAVTPDMAEFTWLVSANTLVRSAVPLFLMLSGMFLLSPEKKTSFQLLFKKYCPRLVIAYVGWSAFYAFYYAVLDRTLFSEGLYGLWTRFFNSHYHLWYLPLLFGIYLLIPFFGTVEESWPHQQTFHKMGILVLFLVIHPALEDTFPMLYDLMNRCNPYWLSVYAAYFFAGYFFSTIKIGKYDKYVWPAVLAASALWFLYSVLSSSALLGALDESRWTPNQLPLALYTISIFMVFRIYGDSVGQHRKIYALIRKISDLSFVIYLCHDIFLDLLLRNGLHALTWHPAISIPVLTVTTLAASMLLAVLLLKLRKMIFQLKPNRS